MGVLLAATIGLVLSVSSAASNNICSGRNNGVQIPNIRDCRSYFVCNHGRVEIFECRDGLMYDYILGVCNWPQNVTCATAEIGLEPPSGQNNVPVVTLPAIVITTTTQRPIITHPPTTVAPTTRPTTTTLAPTTKATTTTPLPPMTLPTVPNPPITQAPVTRPPTTAQPIYTNMPTHPGYPENLPPINMPPVTHPPTYTNLPNFPTHPGYAEHNPPINHPPMTRPPMTHPPMTHPTIAYPPTTLQPTYTNLPAYPGYPHYQGVEGIPDYYYNPTFTAPPHFLEMEGQPEYVNHPIATGMPEYVPTLTTKLIPQKPTVPSTTTMAPTTMASTTMAPTTMAPTTMAPTTMAPTTAAPTTMAPTTMAPIITIPTTVVPATTTTTTTETPVTTMPTFIEYYPGVISSPSDPEVFSCTHDGLYFVPHPRNCQTYFICESHKLHRHQCGPGVHWDYVFAQCVFADTAFCYATSTEEVLTQTTIGVTGPIAIGTISPPTQPPSMPEIVADPIVDCPGNQAFFAHKTDCRKYYICIGGIPIATSCPEKMAWDNEHMQCSEDAELQCLTKSKSE